MKTNKHGFTLVEIIVSIAIAAVVLTLVGGIMFSSWSFLGNTTQSDSYKLKMDELVSVIRTDVQYATDVRFVKEDSRYVPDYETDKDWHYLYIKDGKFYRDGELLLDKGYYEGTNVSIFLRGYKDSNHRMDFNYKLLDSNMDTLYSTKDTVMFLNLSLPDEIANKAFITSEKEYELSNNGYWLFYTKKSTITKPTEPTTNGKDGTVADIRFNINASNYGGLYNGTNKNRYSYNDWRNVIVWYNGYWWERTNGWSEHAPGVGPGWKCLDRNYTNPNFSDTTQLHSSYQKGDVVVYDNNYYRAIKDVDGTDKWNAITNTTFFEKLGAINDPAVIEIVKSTVYTPKTTFSKETVASKLWPANIDMIDPLYPSVNIYNDKMKYEIGSIVKVENQSDDNYYDLYYKRSFAEKHIEPGSANSGWTKISNYYDFTIKNNEYESNSYYDVNDVVLHIGIGENWYIKSKVIIDKTIKDASYGADNKNWQMLSK